MASAYQQMQRGLALLREENDQKLQRSIASLREANLKLQIEMSAVLTELSEAQYKNHSEFLRWDSITNHLTTENSYLAERVSELEMDRGSRSNLNYGV